MNFITETAAKIHSEKWSMTGNASKGTLAAIEVSRAWQEALLANPGGRNLKVEVPISPDLKQRIDVVDPGEACAYELKASPNNGHFEFYKDIFKILIYNKNNDPPLRKLVFMMPKEGAEKLQTGLGLEASQTMTEHGLEVVVHSL